MPIEYSLYIYVNMTLSFRNINSYLILYYLYSGVLSVLCKIQDGATLKIEKKGSEPQHQSKTCPLSLFFNPPVFARQSL